LATITHSRPDAGEDAGRRHRLVVDAVGGQLRQLQERRAGIEQQADPVARQELAAAEVPLPRRFAAALPDRGGEVAECGDLGPHGGGVGGEVRGTDVDLASQDRHGLHRARGVGRAA
jgi:hypothetical protein